MDQRSVETGEKQAAINKNHLDIGRILKKANDKELEVFENNNYMTLLRDHYRDSKKDSTPLSGDQSKLKKLRNKIQLALTAPTQRVTQQTHPPLGIPHANSNKTSSSL